MPLRGLSKILPGLAVAASLYAASAQAVVIYAEDNTTPDSIAGVANFATNGALMSGMTITATFSGGLTETIAWATTGADSGAAVGTGWQLSEDGDTFGGTWTFAFLDDTIGMLTSLSLDGAPGLTLFDRSFGGLDGTTGSALGMDFAFTGPDFDVTATYSRPIGIGAAVPVGDLFHQLDIDFGELGPRTGSFTFVQDTDNDAARQVPEPAMLGLFGLALAGFGAVRLRRTA
jgi:hypothetical protein